MLRMAFPQRSMASLATHLRKTSPMNSVSESFAPGENQGAWKVSVRARCCSAMTRRDIRYGENANVSTLPATRPVQVYKVNLQNVRWYS